MITLTQLEYIVALDDVRHFAAAADKCFVTQPTLSMQVKKLEEDLGVIIFDRKRQPLEPTEIGKKIISQARAALASSNRIKEIIREEQRVVSGTLRIGIIPTLAPYLLPPLMKQMAQEYPDLEIGVEEVESEELVRRLKSERLDVGIFVTPYNDNTIVEKPVFYEEMLIYAHPGHELLHQKGIDANELKHAGLWLLGEGHCFRNQVVNLCNITQEDEGRLPFRFESNSLETLMRIVDAEGGYTFIPELALQYLPENKLLQVRSFASDKPLREVSVISSIYFVRQQLVELLWQAIRSVVPEQMWQRERGMVVEWKTKNNTNLH